MLLLAFFLRSHWPPDYCQPTMVRLIDATACAGKADLKPEDVLKPENLAKAASEMKSLSAKDIDHQCSRDLRERYPEFSYVDCYVRRINGENMFDEIKKKWRFWQLGKGLQVRGGWPTVCDGQS